MIRALAADRRLRVVPTFLGAHEIPDDYRDSPEEYVDAVIDEMLPEVAAESLAEYCDVFCEPHVFPVDQARAILRAAQSYRLGVRIHADQFTPDSGSLLAAELGAATADHLECTTDAGIAALARAGVQPVLLPGSVYALGSARYPAARRMIEAGLAPVIATDFNPGSSPTASMPMMLSLASTHMGMTPAESITAATINAACSLGRAGPDRFARTRQTSRLRHPRLPGLPRTRLLLRTRARAGRLFRRRLRLPARNQLSLRPSARPLYWKKMRVGRILAPAIGAAW